MAVASATPTSTAGAIHEGDLYHVDELKRRLGWSKHAMRTARRNGLVVHYSGGRAYILGRDAIAYISQCATRKAGA